MIRGGEEWTIKPIGWAETPFGEKFAVPRQSTIIHHGRFIIHFYSPYNREEAFIGITGFSHIWVSFIFDEIPIEQTGSLCVKPPRLGGNVHKGIFATRSPFRPNRIGLSLAKLKEVSSDKNGVILKLDGLDLVDKTPIIDIKPYIRFVDSRPDAVSGFAEDVPPMMNVEFTDAALKQTIDTGIDDFPDFIKEILAQDPRPAYKHALNEPDRIYGVLLYGYNVQWIVQNNIALVVSVLKGFAEK